MRAFILDSNQENFKRFFSYGPASKFISYQSRRAQSLARWSMLTKNCFTIRSTIYGCCWPTFGPLIMPMWCFFDMTILKFDCIKLSFYFWMRHFKIRKYCYMKLQHHRSCTYCSLYFASDHILILKLILNSYAAICIADNNMVISVIGFLSTADRWS
jgi:hypothetical protein